MTHEEKNELEKAMLGRGISYEVIQMVMKDFTARMESKHPYQRVIEKPHSGDPDRPFGWAGDLIHKLGEPYYGAGDPTSGGVCDSPSGACDVPSGSIGIRPGGHGYPHQSPGYNIHESAGSSMGLVSGTKTEDIKELK